MASGAEVTPIRTQASRPARASPSAGNPTLIFPNEFKDYLGRLPVKKGLTDAWRRLITSSWEKLQDAERSKWRADFEGNKEVLLKEVRNKKDGPKRLERRFNRRDLAAELHLVYGKPELKCDEPEPRLLAALFQHAVTWICDELRPAHLTTGTSEQALDLDLDVELQLDQFVDIHLRDDAPFYLNGLDSPVLGGAGLDELSLLPSLDLEATQEPVARMPRFHPASPGLTPKAGLPQASSDAEVQKHVVKLQAELELQKLQAESATSRLTDILAFVDSKDLKAELEAFLLLRGAPTV